MKRINKIERHSQLSSLREAAQRLAVAIQAAFWIATPNKKRWAPNDGKKVENRVN